MIFLKMLLEYSFSVKIIYLFIIVYIAIIMLLYHRSLQPRYLMMHHGEEDIIRSIIKRAVITMIALLPAIVFIIFLSIEQIEFEKPKEYEIVKQIEKLDDMQNSLRDLQNLISAQKVILLNTEKYIKNLEIEKLKLEPIVKADKEIVESILTFQKEKMISQIWKERFIGFLISLLAGFIIIIIRNFWKSLKLQQNTIK